MPSTLKTSVSAPPFQAVTPTRQYSFVSQGAWSTANSAASLAGAQRDDQLAEPTDSSSTGEYAFDPEGSILFVKTLLRGASAAIARGHVLTANLWEWSQIQPSANGGGLLSWTPNLVGRWTFQFNTTGNAALNTVGVAGAAVLDTDIYSSNVAVVATYDRRGDYALRWKVLQPAADDGSPAIIMIDGLGSNRYSWEGRTTTNGDAFMFLHRWASSV